MVRFPHISVGELVAAGEAELKTGPFGTQLKASEYTEHGTPVINVRNIGFGSIKADKLEFISPTTRERLSSHLLKRGDIVFGRKGAVERHVFIRQEQDGWLQGSDCLRLRFASRRVEPLFASYYFLTEDHQRWMMNQCSHGATMASLNQGILERIELPLPSLPVQRRIAGILAAYDELIENSQRRIKILESMARALYREWFVHFRFPGHENTRLVDDLPDGWTRRSLEEVAELKLGKMLDQKKNRGELLPYLANVNVRWGEFDLRDLREMRFEQDEIEAFGLKAGDIVMCEGGEPGRCAVWKEQLPGMMIQKAIHRIRCRKNMDSSYLYQSLRHLGQSGHLATFFTGATIKHLPREKLAKVKVVVPPAPLLDKFGDITASMEAQIHALQCQTQNLRRTRDLLLPRLLSGQIDVEALADA